MLHSGRETERLDGFIAQLLALADEAAQQQLLAAELATRPDRAQQDTLVEALRAQVIELQRAEVDQAQQVAQLLLYLSGQTGVPAHRAVALRMIAQVLAFGRGELQRALELYDEALRICQAEGDELGRAHIQVTRIWSLANVGRYDEAFAAGEWAAPILEAHQQWRSLASLQTNLAIAHSRLNNDSQALAMLDQADEAYRRLGKVGEQYLPGLHANRAIILYQLGQYRRAIRACQTAIKLQNRLGHHLFRARTQVNLARTHIALGQYNNALLVLEEARETLRAEGAGYAAAVADNIISECLLQLRRFHEALENCRRLRAWAGTQGMTLEHAHALHVEARTYIALNRFAEAEQTLTGARELFVREGNEVWTATIDLERASLLCRLENYEESQALALDCAALYNRQRLPVSQAQAELVAAGAALRLGRHNQAGQLLQGVLALAGEKQLFELQFQAHHLLARLLAPQNRPAALKAIDNAILAVERLRSNLMLEHRAGYLEDKQVLYEDAVLLCIETGDAAQGLHYAERAKSRALLELLEFRLDLSIKPRHAADQPLVDEIIRLRAERDRLYRRQSLAHEPQPQRRLNDQVNGELLALEKRITDLWHTLLVRNAGYARDAALWQVHTAPAAPHLRPDEAIVEYFIAAGRPIAFVITSQGVEVQQLETTLPAVQQLLQLLRMNVELVTKAGPGRAASLLPNVKGILHRLYKALFAPLRPSLAENARLFVVPHGPLHYLPFHSLYDGEQYLVQRHAISYLPGSSFLGYYRETEPAGQGLVAVGHSYGGVLPQTIAEAQTIAAEWDGRLLLEDEATLAQVQAAAETCRILHLATHGDFRADNPLFSGLALADGWLATLDIFNLELQASLVTLSACQTGRFVVAGGDELLGLMRAFLSAGAASLLLTQWAVEDHSTAALMRSFYCKLAAGLSKRAALRAAQIAFIQGEVDDTSLPAEALPHPYYWAPFFLVGNPASL